MKLSEAIRLGAMLKPQAIGVLYHEGKTCALGAACDALGLDMSTVAALDFADVELTRRFPLLNERVDHPVHRDRCWDVAATITNLNDWLIWTREQIADWVQTIEEQQPAKDIEDPVHVPAEVA